MLWNTAAITEALKDLGTIHHTLPDGEYDSTQISVHYEGERIIVKGWTDSITVTDSNNVEVSWVELRTYNGDSSGGLQTKNEDVGAVYGRISARLQQMGFNIVPHYNNLF